MHCRVVVNNNSSSSPPSSSGSQEFEDASVEQLEALRRAQEAKLREDGAKMRRMEEAIQRKRMAEEIKRKEKEREAKLLQELQRKAALEAQVQYDTVNLRWVLDFIYYYFTWRDEEIILFLIQFSPVLTPQTTEAFARGDGQRVHDGADEATDGDDAADGLRHRRPRRGREEAQEGGGAEEDGGDPVFSQEHGGQDHEEPDDGLRDEVHADSDEEPPPWRRGCSHSGGQAPGDQLQARSRI